MTAVGLRGQRVIVGGEACTPVVSTVAADSADSSFLMAANDTRLQEHTHVGNGMQKC
jgi:hypothetical protein